MPEVAETMDLAVKVMLSIMSSINSDKLLFFRTFSDFIEQFPPFRPLIPFLIVCNMSILLRFKFYTNLV